MAIQVKHLIEELQKLDSENYIVMSSDPEGNNYEFLEGIYINHKLHDGEVYLAELTQELIEAGYDEEDVSKEGVDCIVLYPGQGTHMLEALLNKEKEAV